MKQQKIYFIILFLILFSISNIIIFKHLNNVEIQQINLLKDMLKNEAITLYDNIVATRHWNAIHGGIYVKQKDALKPNPYLDNNTIETKDGEILIKVNPAWMTKQISKISNEKNRHNYNITSLTPLNPENAPNLFEKKALEYLKQHEHKKFYYEFAEAFTDFKLIGALKADKSCLQCHAKQNYKIGDLVGGVSIQLPTSQYKNKYHSVISHYSHFKNLIIIFSIFLFIVTVLLIINFFNKRELLYQNLKQLKQLKDENETLVRRYKFALEASQIGIWDWDLKSNKVFFDKNWKGMLGYEENELANSLEEWDIRVHPDDKQKAIKDIQSSHNKETESYTNIHRLKHKNGEWVWIYDKGKTYFDENNQPSRMIGSHTNITQLKELELKLLEREQNLSFAQEIAHMGHWKYYLKKDEFFISNSLKKLLGLEDKNNDFNYDDFKNLIHPNDLENFIQMHKEALNSCERINLQYKLKKINSNKYIDINEYISCIRPANNRNEDRMYIGVIQDITHLKNLENDLTLFSTIINNSPISIMITNPNGDIIYVNPHFTETSGYEKKEIIGKNPRILKSDDTSEELYKNLWLTITNKKTWGGIFKNITKDKKEYWETALVIPIMNEKGEIINFLGIKREITKEIFLKKQLEEKEELMLNQSKHAAMGEMISMIAHQWRQPITTISMAANNILADIELDMLNNEEAKKFANEVSTQTQYLSNTIEDFRNFFKQDKDVETVDLETIFNDTSSIILASLKNNGIDFILNFDKTIQISTYRRELVQVLINIIKNAKEALQEKDIKVKKIEIKIVTVEDKISIEIIDNAGGIKDEIIDKIFEAYFTTKDQQNGTGLGLYMSKMIIEKHLKGKISVYNTNEGATFKIILPQTIN
jgi:PAS domain S-box-containing protein